MNKNLQSQRRLTFGLNFVLSLSLLWGEEVKDYSKAYWDGWNEARTLTRTDYVKAVSSYEHAHAYLILAKKAEKGPVKKHKLHLSNEIQMLCEVETLTTKMGLMGKSNTFRLMARNLMADYFRVYNISKDNPVDPEINITGIYLNQLFDEAEMYSSQGNLSKASEIWKFIIAIAEQKLSGSEKINYIRRGYNEMANAIWDAGDLRLAFETFKRGLAVSPSPERTEYLKLSTLRIRSQIFGPSEEIVAELKSYIAEMEKSKNKAMSFQAKRRLATIYHLLGQDDQAKDLFAELGKTNFSGDVTHEDDLQLWKAKADIGDFVEEEQRLLEMLRAHRAKGRKMDEYRVYKAYGELCSKHHDDDKAVKAFESSLSLCQSFGLSNRKVVILSHLAILYTRLGKAQQAQQCWTKIDESYQNEKISINGKLETELNRCEYYTLVGNHAAAMRTLEGLLDPQFEFSDYEKNSIHAKKKTVLQQQSSVVIESKEQSLKQRSAVDFLPEKIDIFPREQSQNYVHVAIRTTDASYGHGHLSLNKCYFKASWSEDRYFLILDLGQPEVDHLPLHLVTGIDQHLLVKLAEPTKKLSTKLAWSCAGKVISEADITAQSKVQGNSYVCNVVSKLNNMFDEAVIYHYIESKSMEEGSNNLKVECDQPLRIEILDDRSGAYMAIDHGGNGSFMDIGDVLSEDSENDGFPNVKSGSNGQVLRLKVMPIDKVAMKSLQVRVYMGKVGQWGEPSNYELRTEIH